jgi:hypothetical protein
VTQSGNGLSVEGANSVVIVYTSATNYVLPKNDSFIFFDNTARPLETVCIFILFFFFIFFYFLCLYIPDRQFFFIFLCIFFLRCVGSRSFENGGGEKIRRPESCAC